MRYLPKTSLIFFGNQANQYIYNITGIICKLLATTKVNIQADVDAIQSISIVPQLLDVICRITRMGFAAIARVTDEKWVICGVNDEISFGLVPGGELKLETTICNEIRQHQTPVVIDHVLKNDFFKNHHTPAMYGFQSYISVPIIKKDGSFFGTLCAIDPLPRKLENPEIMGMFTLFADLISKHLEVLKRLKSPRQIFWKKNALLI